MPEVYPGRGEQADGGVWVRAGPEGVHATELRGDGGPVQVGLLQHARPPDTHEPGGAGVLAHTRQYRSVQPFSVGYYLFRALMRIRMTYCTDQDLGSGNSPNDFKEKTYNFNFFPQKW